MSYGQNTSDTNEFTGGRRSGNIGDTGPGYGSNMQPGMDQHLGGNVHGQGATTNPDPMSTYGKHTHTSGRDNTQSGYGVDSPSSTAANYGGSQTTDSMRSGQNMDSSMHGGQTGYGQGNMPSADAAYGQGQTRIPGDQYDTSQRTSGMGTTGAASDKMSRTSAGMQSGDGMNTGSGMNTSSGMNTGSDMNSSGMHTGTGAHTGTGTHTGTGMHTGTGTHTGAATGAAAAGLGAGGGAAGIGSGMRNAAGAGMQTDKLHPGQHDTDSSGRTEKPTVTDKIVGGVEKATGKVTSNAGLYQKGEERASGERRTASQGLN